MTYVVEVCGIKMNSNRDGKVITAVNLVLHFYNILWTSDTIVQKYKKSNCKIWAIVMITAILQTSTCGESPGSLVAMHVGKGWFSRAEREGNQWSKIQYGLYEYVGLQCNEQDTVFA